MFKPHIESLVYILFIVHIYLVPYFWVTCLLCGTIVKFRLLGLINTFIFSLITAWIAKLYHVPYKFHHFKWKNPKYVLFRLVYYRLRKNLTALGNIFYTSVSIFAGPVSLLRVFGLKFCCIMKSDKWNSMKVIGHLRWRQLIKRKALRSVWNPRSQTLT